MAQPIRTYTDETPAKITFKMPTLNPSGQGKSALVNEFAYYVTPSMKVAFGVDVTENKKTIRGQGDATDAFYAWLDRLQANVIDFVANTPNFQAALFGANGGPKSIEVIKDRFHKMVTESEEYGAGVRFKLTENTQYFILVDENEQAVMKPATIDDIKKNTNVKVVCQFGPLWSNGTRFGLIVRATQVLIEGYYNYGDDADGADASVVAAPMF